MRMHGEPPGQLYFRQRKTKLRPLILILDVSGSMADYSRHLLQFAHTARHAAAAQGRVEVFCFGTQADPHHPGAGAPSGSTRRWSEAARTVSDWDGGTRIGQSLDELRPARGAGAVCAAAGWWSSAPTGWTAAIPRCSRRRWSGWPGCATGSCG